MNIQNRLEKLEKAVTPDGLQLRECCQHPPSVFRLRQQYSCLWRKPANDKERHNTRGGDVLGRFGEHPLIIAGHCDSCGFDGPLWDVSKTTPEQWKTYCSLLESNHNYGSEGYHKADYYASWLIENGYLSFSPWPPTPELKDWVNKYGGLNEHQK